VLGARDDLPVDLHRDGPLGQAQVLEQPPHRHAVRDRSSLAVHGHFHASVYHAAWTATSAWARCYLSGMATEKLYWNDPFALAFQSSRATVSAWEGKPSLVLPATAFYPEAGGQLGDTGWLDVAGSRVAVEDTQIADDGTIHHLVASARQRRETGTHAVTPRFTVFTLALLASRRLISLVNGAGRAFHCLRTTL